MTHQVISGPGRSSGLGVGPSGRRGVEEDIQRRNLVVVGNDDVDTGVSWRFARGPRTPIHTSAVLYCRRRAMRRIDIAGMTGTQVTADPVECVVAVVLVDRQIDYAVFGIQLLDSGASAFGVAFTKD